MSDFFDEPAPTPEPDPPERYRPPPWVHAPPGVLPGIVPLELLVARTGKVAVCVTRLAAYPSGFEVDVVTMSGDDDELDPMLFGPHLARRGRVKRGQPMEPEMLRFGVQFADGAKATNTGSAAFDFGAHEEPTRPVLHPGGGSGGGGSWRQTFWVWPLPPAGRLTFVCEWPAAGIPLTRHEIDAEEILAAAGRAQVVFTDDASPHPPGTPGSFGSAGFHR